MASVVDRLAMNSSLTRAQFETLILQRRVIGGELTAKSAAENRQPAPVAVGTYHRVLGQARTKVREAVITVLLSTSLGLIDSGELKKLLDMLGRGKLNEDSQRINELMQLIDEIVSRIVMV